MKLKLQPKVDIDTKAIEADILKFADIYCSTIAKEATNLINQFAFQEMVGYYNEYTPSEYDRTYQMALHSYKPYWSQTGSTYEGGIIIDSGFTNHIPKAFSESQLYNEVWAEGHHGQEHLQYQGVDIWRTIQGEPNRIDKLKKKAYSDKTKELLINKAMKAARSAGGYSILKF